MNDGGTANMENAKGKCDPTRKRPDPRLRLSGLAVGGTELVEEAWRLRRQRGGRKGQAKCQEPYSQ